MSVCLFFSVFVPSSPCFQTPFLILIPSLLTLIVTQSEWTNQRNETPRNEREESEWLFPSTSSPLPILHPRWQKEPKTASGWNRLIGSTGWMHHSWNLVCNTMKELLVWEIETGRKGREESWEMKLRFLFSLSLLYYSCLLSCFFIPTIRWSWMWLFESLHTERRKFELGLKSGDETSDSLVPSPTFWFKLIPLTALINVKGVEECWRDENYLDQLFVTNNQ